MDPNVTLEKIWQLSDEYELVKGTIEGRIKSQLTSDGKLLILCNGKGIFCINTKNIFKKKPLYRFTIKAEELITLFANDAPETKIEQSKRLLYLKTFLKTTENVKRSRKGKVETLQSIVAKFKHKQHLLTKSNLLAMFCSENLRREALIFKQFMIQEGKSKLRILVETNLQDWMIFEYDLEKKVMTHVRLSALDSEFREAVVLSATFAASLDEKLAVLISSDSKSDLKMVLLRFGGSVETVRHKEVVQLPFSDLSFKIMAVKAGDKYLLCSDNDILWVQITEYKKMFGSKNHQDSDRVQIIGLRNSIVQPDKPFIRPLEVQVQDSQMYFLYADNLALFDTHKQQFFELLNRPNGSFKKLILRNSGLYVLDRSQVIWVSATNSQSFNLETRELSVLIDVNFSPNEHLLYAFGKTGELFGSKTDLLLCRNMIRIVSKAVNCFLYEFLLFASNTFKILIKRSRTSRTVDSLEIAHNPFFDLLDKLPEKVAAKLKAEFFWYSGNQSAFSQQRMLFLKLNAPSSALLFELTEKNGNVTCLHQNCVKSVTSFAQSWLKVTCADNHVSYIAADSPDPIVSYTNGTCACLKCELLFQTTDKCQLCDSKLA